MPKDKNNVDVVPGDIVTIRAIVRSTEVGEGKKNLRVETYDNGGSQPATELLLNSAQAEKAP